MYIKLVKKYVVTFELCLIDGEVSVIAISAPEIDTQLKKISDFYCDGRTKSFNLLMISYNDEQSIHRSIFILSIILPAQP